MDEKYAGLLLKQRGILEDKKKNTEEQLKEINTKLLNLGIKEQIKILGLQDIPEMKEDYNNAINNGNCDFFYKKYLCIKVDKQPMEDVSKDYHNTFSFSSLKLIEHSVGPYIAISNFDNSYVVIPQLPIYVEDALFAFSGFGDLFDSRNYDKGQYYNKIKLLKPAIMRKDDDTFVVISKGEIDLQS